MGKEGGGGVFCRAQWALKQNRGGEDCHTGNPGSEGPPSFTAGGGEMEGCGEKSEVHRNRAAAPIVGGGQTRVRKHTFVLVLFGGKKKLTKGTNYKFIIG